MTGNALSEREILNLWQVAWRMARRRCAATLARLARGEGGFYSADDLQQDLFLEFWALAQAWHCRGAGLGELWLDWRRRLWGGGRRILRRAPQRLWRGVEWAVDPLALDPAEAQGGAPAAAAASSGERSALVQPEDAEATRHGLSRLEALERALWALPPAQRQLIYMATLLEVPPAEVARLLALKDVQVVYRRLHLARRALRRQLLLEET